MTLTDFYDKVEDQFTPETLKKLLDYYIDNGDIYESIIYSNGVFEDGLENYHNYLMNMFNRFKNHLLSMRGNGVYIREGEFDFLRELVNKLSNMPEYNNWEEFLEARKTIFSGEDREFRDYFAEVEKHIGKPFIMSLHMDKSYISKYDIKHRLYLNIENISDGEKILNYLMDRCEQEKIAYEFKFWCQEGRSDQIVIYTSSSDLLKFIDYLEDFKKKFPDVVSRVHMPSILAGVYDGWIGYGTEPDKSNFSFNSLRGNIIEAELDKNLSKAVGRARSKKYNYNGEMLSLEDYIANEITDNIINRDLRYNKNMKLADNNREFLFDQIKYIVIDNLKKPSLINKSCDVQHLLADGSKKRTFFSNCNKVLVGVLKDDNDFIVDLYDSIKDRYKENGILEKSCFDSYIIEEMRKIDTEEVKGDEFKMVYDNKLNEEFLKLLQELKNPSYDRKERSKFVVRVEQIIEIYRNEIHNNEFADTLVKAFNNAQKVYEERLQKMESKPSTEEHGKHFKTVHLESDKTVSLSENMESDIENNYKTSSQKVDEALDKKMAEINRRVDNGETLDSKIDDLSKYVSDLNKRRAEINNQFKDVWVSGDEDKFDELLKQDNEVKDLINENKSELERRKEIRQIVDEQIASEEITHDLEKYESDVNYINNNSSLTDEQKKMLIDQIYAEFDRYVEEHPEENGFRR